VRGVIWLILLFVVAVVAATTLGVNDGLVSLYWAGWRTDLSLNFFLLLVVGGCFLLMAAVSAIGALVSLPRRASEWRTLRRERAANAALREALGEYFGARYSRSHKAAQKALALQPDVPDLRGDAEFAVIAHLLAAGSLHRLQDRQRRDRQLEGLLALPGTARSAHDGARIAAAEWALDDRDAERALELLGALPPGVARRTQALRLRLQATRLARRPLEALHTARLLANHQAFTPVAAQGLLRSLAFEALESTHDGQQLCRLWEQLEPADRRDPLVAARAAQRAAALGLAGDGRLWLRPFWERLGELGRDEREAVALATVDVASAIGPDWLPRLESALSKHGHEPAVQAAVGTVFGEQALWGKARSLLEQAASAASLPSAARRRAWRRLAGMARRDGDDAAAARCDRAAAELD
jgi:HemY protein